MLFYVIDMYVNLGREYLGEP